MGFVTVISSCFPGISCRRTIHRNQHKVLFLPHDELMANWQFGLF